MRTDERLERVPPPDLQNAVTARHDLVGELAEQFPVPQEPILVVGVLGTIKAHLEILGFR
jgi:hypothetical protein